MSVEGESLSGRARIVLGDANVLYSRVLRDYLVYASDEGMISIRWSAAILDEVVEHLGAEPRYADQAAIALDEARACGLTDGRSEDYR